MEKAKVSYTSSLFQHIGVKSSLKGKIQNLKVCFCQIFFKAVKQYLFYYFIYKDQKFHEKKLTKAPNRIKMKNRAAKIGTLLESYEGNTLQKLYDQTGFFWTKTLNTTHFIQINFTEPFLLNQ